MSLGACMKVVIFRNFIETRDLSLFIVSKDPEIELSLNTSTKVTLPMPKLFSELISLIRYSERSLTVHNQLY